MGFFGYFLKAWLSITMECDTTLHHLSFLLIALSNNSLSWHNETRMACHYWIVGNQMFMTNLHHDSIEQPMQNMGKSNLIEWIIVTRHCCVPWAMGISIPSRATKEFYFECSSMAGFGKTHSYQRVLLQVLKAWPDLGKHMTAVWVVNSSKLKSQKPTTICQQFRTRDQYKHI